MVSTATDGSGSAAESRGAAGKAVTAATVRTENDDLAVHCTGF
jgi:hypothetical protein